MHQTETQIPVSGHATTRRRLPTGKRTALSVGSPFASLTQYPGTIVEPSRKSVAAGSSATPSIGSIRIADVILLSVLRQKDNVKGRQECLPHLQTRFLNGSKSYCAGVKVIHSRIKQLTVTIHELITLVANICERSVVFGRSQLSDYVQWIPWGPCSAKGIRNLPGISLPVHAHSSTVSDRTVTVDPHAGPIPTGPIRPR